MSSSIPFDLSSTLHSPFPSSHSLSSSSSSPFSSSSPSSSSSTTSLTSLFTPTSTLTPSSTLSTPSSTSPPPSPSSVSSPPSTSAPVAQQTYSSSAPTTLTTSAGIPTQDPYSSVVVYTSAATTPSHTVTNSPPSGFFSNTGAVASTFTITGLVSIAALIAVVLLILKRRHSRSYDEDMEYLDKTTNLSVDPPMTHLTSPDDDGFTSDHGHYSTPPMTLAAPALYYPDHPYTFHPAGQPAPHGYPSPYPAGYNQDHATQYGFFPDNYDITYTRHVNSNIPNPQSFVDVEQDSTPVHANQSTPPDALRPTVNPTPSVPKQWTNTRLSVDSFYAGMVKDNRSSSGQAP